jgi:hypothetical protein
MGTQVSNATRPTFEADLYERPARPTDVFNTQTIADAPGGIFFYARAPPAARPRNKGKTADHIHYSRLVDQSELTHYPDQRRMVGALPGHHRCVRERRDVCLIPVRTKLCFTNRRVVTGLSDAANSAATCHPIRERGAGWERLMGLSARPVVPSSR